MGGGQPQLADLVVFLHAHLPYVRDPEDENGLAEGWFFEAVTETYIPLLSIAEGWVRDGLPARMTVSLSPPLLEMLRDELLVTRYVDRMHALLELADSEVRRTASDERFRATAEMNRARLADAVNRFEHQYSGDLTAAFAALQDRGVLELVTSCATHAFLPGFDESYASAQIALGARCYQHHFGRRSPACGYPSAASCLELTGCWPMRRSATFWLMLMRWSSPSRGPFSAPTRRSFAPAGWRRLRVMRSLQHRCGAPRLDIPVPSLSRVLS